MLGEEEPTVPCSLPLLLMATNSSLFTPYRLTTPRSTAEISIRPEQKGQTPRQRLDQSCSTQVLCRDARARWLCSEQNRKARSDNSNSNLLWSYRSALSTGHSGFGTSEGVGVKISSSLSISVQAFVSCGYFTVSHLLFSFSILCK